MQWIWIYVVVMHNVNIKLTNLYFKVFTHQMVDMHYHMLPPQHRIYDHIHYRTILCDRTDRCLIRAHCMQRSSVESVPILDQSERLARPGMQMGSPAVCRWRWRLQCSSHDHRLYPTGICKILPLSLHEECFHWQDVLKLYEIHIN